MKVLLKKRNPAVKNNFYLVYRLVYISDSMNEFRQLFSQTQLRSNRL